MREVEFREGRRLVPDYIADRLAAFETYQMTYEEAMKKFNASLLNDRLASAQSKVVRDHLARFGSE